MRFALLTAGLLLLSATTFATHLRGGYIKVRRMNQASRTCEITIVIYTNTKNTPVKMGGDPDLSYLFFGDGKKEFVAETDNVFRYDLDPSGAIAEATYVTFHTYEDDGQYQLSYREPNRNAGVLNMDNSVSTFFYVETTINLVDDFHSTPEFLAPPVFYGLSQEPFSASIAAVGSDDNSLYYQIAIPQGDGVPVGNYRLPENFDLNMFNGHISWDTKLMNSYVVGEFAFAAKIKEFHGDQLLSIVVFDFQIIINPGTPQLREISSNKTVDENARIYVPENTTTKFKVFVEDPSSDELSIDAFSELLNEQHDGSLSFSTYDSISTVNGDEIKVGVVEISNSEAIVRSNPYPLVIRGVYDRNQVRYKDLTFLIYTTDTELDPDIVLATEDEKRLIEVYPNPTTDFIFLDDERVKAFSIYSIEGILHQSGAPSNDRSVDVQRLKPGFYVLKLNSGQKKGETVKLIKH